MLRIHREGTSIVAFVGIITAGLTYLLGSTNQWWSLFAIVIVLIFFALVLYFFRYPDRKISSPLPDQVLAPADGKVVVIEEVDEPEYLQRKCLQLSIFMSPLNVHVNWNPISGKVVYQKHHPGKYLVAWHPKSSTENERTTIVYEMKNGQKILVRQIAGAVARRIVNYLTEGDEVEQGGEMGFIKFGSRVDVFLPVDAKIRVKLDQKSQGNRTVLAEL